MTVSMGKVAMHTIRRLVALLVFACGFVAPAFAQSYSYSVYVDRDNNSATGCTVTLPNGTVAGAEAVLTATVAAGSPPTVTSVTRSTCSAGSFGAPVAEGVGAVSVGTGNGGTTSIELGDSVVALAGTSGGPLRLYVVARSATGDDVLLTTNGTSGGPILLALAPPVAAPLIGWPALLLLVALLLALGSRAVRRRVLKRVLLGLVFVSGIAGAGIFNWSGISPIATDPAGDTTSGEDQIDLRFFYAVATNGNLDFRIDVTGGLVATPPVAAADSYTALVGTAFSLAAPGVFANDQLGMPAATLSSFGGGSLGGAVTDHAAGSGVPFGASGGTLTVNADGSFALTAPTTAGTYTFQYRLSNSQGTSDGTVTVQVNQVPAITSAANTTFTAGTAGTFTVTTIGTPVAAIALGGVALPSGVTYVDNGDGTGTLAGTPALGSGGNYAITFTPSNTAGTGTTQNFTLTVVQISSAVADNYTIVHDSTLTTTPANGVLANDTGTSLTVSQLIATTSCAPACTAATANGSVTMNADGSFTYTPNANFAGTDTFSYTAHSPLPLNDSPATVTITVTDAAPVVDLNGSASGIDFNASFTEGGGAVAIVDAANLTVVDSDSANLGSATVTLTNLLDTGAETLGVTCPDASPGCSGAIQLADVVYDGTTGVLTITRVAPLADYQALLRTLEYNDASQNPDTTARNITVAVNDQIVDNSPLANITVTMTAVNNAPTITAPATALVSANPGTFAFTGANTISVADVDGGTNPEKVTLTATHGTISALGSTAGLTASGVGTSLVTLTGPLGNLNTALSGATFAPDAGFSGSGAGVAVNINDQGYSLGGTTQGTVQQANANVAITVDAAPQVVGTTPLNNATSVLPSTTIVFNFDKAVNASATGFTLSCNASAVAFSSVPALPSSGAGSTTFTLTPSAQLLAGASCVATAVAAQIKDTTAVQTPMAADVAVNFTVNTLPTVTSVLPANGATIQPLTSTVTIAFSEQVNVTGAAFKLECPVGTPVGFSVTPASPATTFVLHPSANLPPTTTCTVTVVAAQVTDVDAGQQMAANFVSTFTTATPPAIVGGATASATFTIGLANSYAINTTGAPAVNNIVLGGTALPLGAVFNYTGGASSASVTAAAGAFNAAQVGTTNGITFTASNGITPDAVQTLALTIQCPAMSVSGSLPNGLYGQPYGPQAFSVVGGNGSAISWSIPTGIVGGLSINGSTGVVSGTPTNTVSNGTVTIRATDAYGCNASTTFTTFTVAPVAVPETYDKVVGNTQFVITGTGTPAPATPYVDGLGLAAGFSKVVANDQGPGTLTVSPTGTVATANGGSVTIQADGSFNFTPKAGDTAASDSFTYTIVDGNGVSSAPATVTLTFSGGRVWYVNGAAGVNGSGVSSSPFNTLASASTAHVAGASAATGDVIFVESGAATATPGAISLKQFATLWGQGVALATNGVAIPSLSIPIQNTGATTKPVLNGTVTLAGSGTTVSSLDINTSGVPGLANSGTLTAVTVTNNVTVSSTSSTAVNLSNVSGALTFRSISANGGPNGISLSGTGGSFSVSGDGGATANGSGGSIGSAVGAGVLLSNAAGVSLRQMNISSAHASGIDASLAGTTLVANLMNITNSGSTASDNGVTLTNVGSASLTGSTVSGSANDGVHLLQSGGTLAASTIYGNAFSNHAAGYGVHVQTAGAGAIANLAIGGAAAGQPNTFANNNIGVSIEQAVTTAATTGDITFAVQNNSFSNNAAGNTFSQAINVESNGVHSIGGTITGQIENNTIGTQGTKDSGSAVGDGVRADIEGGVHGVLTISGNTLREVPNGFGFEIRGVGGPGGRGGLNVKLSGNTVANPSGSNLDVCGFGSPQPCPLSSVYLAADNADTAATTQTVCAIVSGNTAYDPQAAWVQGAGQFAYQLDQLFSPPASSVFNLGGTHVDAVTEINATNTVNTNTAVTNGTVNIVAVATCGAFPP